MALEPLKEMVLASQCTAAQAKENAITIDGTLQNGVTPKDVALFIISQLTASELSYFKNTLQGFKNMSMKAATV